MTSRKQNEFRQMITGRPIQVGNKGPAIKSAREFMDNYVSHIRGCEFCNSEVIFHFMTANQMASAIIRTHRAK